MAWTLPFPTLARALAQEVPHSDLLPELHRAVLTATGGSRSFILRRCADGSYLGMAAPGLPPSVTLDSQTAESLQRRSLPALVDLSAFASLRSQIGGTRALVVPVPAAQRPPLLCVTDPTLTDPEVLEAAARIAIEFGVAIEWDRVARERVFHQRLREFALAAARRTTSPLSLPAALDALSQDTNALLGTRKTTVWLHDRLARELVLTGSSEPRREGMTTRVAADDATAPPARGLRLECPQMLSGDSEPILAAPLRGWRRALGAVIIEGEHATDLDDDQRLDAVHELASQLSVVIENLQLLEQILRQRRLLENTFNSLIDLVAVIDNNLRLVQINDAFAIRAARTRDDLIGERLDELIDDGMTRWIVESPENLAPSSSEGRSAGPPASRTRTFDAPKLGGVFVVTVTPLASLAGDVVGRVVVARDTTVQARLEAEREGLRTRLAQSEKLASLGQFVAGIAHEMNNPLQGVLGHLELLLRDARAARPIRSDLRRIYNDAERAAKIVRNLLVFSGTRRMLRRRVKVDRILARALSSRRAALIQTGITVERRQPAALPPIVGDPLLLQQAFLNVLINAEHALASTGDQGRIEIDTVASADGTAVITTIRDTGSGIPEDVLPRIFDPFFTTKEVGKGTGLGLAITYGIVHEHGGTIHARNAPERGAIFTIELPAAPL